MTSATTSLALLAALSFLAAARGAQVRQMTPPYIHSEGPSWDSVHQGLLFVDIAANTLHFYSPRTGADHWLTLEGPVSPAIQLRGGSLAVGVGRTLQEIPWAASGFSSALPSPPKVLATVDDDKPGNRFNDGNVDSRGRLWIGTMGPEPVVGQVTPDQASLYRITRRWNVLQPMRQRSAALVTKALSPVSISNGLVFNARETLMYYIDTPTRRVDVFDYNLVDGTIANRRTAFDFAAHNVLGNPDGMAIDADDNLWVACFGGSQVIQVEPRSGRLLRRVAIPASQVTAVALGGPADDTMYVTTMRKGLSDDQLLQEPAAGAVFAVTGLGVRPQRRL